MRPCTHALDKAAFNGVTLPELLSFRRAMLTINKLIAQGRGLAAVLLKRASHLELGWDVRQKSRFDATDPAAVRSACSAARTLVRGGDVLVAEDGSLIVVKRQRAGDGGASLQRARLAV